MISFNECTIIFFVINLQGNFVVCANFQIQVFSGYLEWDLQIIFSNKLKSYAFFSSFLQSSLEYEWTLHNSLETNVKCYSFDNILDFKVA